MLTKDDQKKCSELFEWATCEKTAPGIWNEKAADLLAQMYLEILKCSDSMNLVPRFPGIPGFNWLLKEVYKIIERAFNNKREIYEVCLRVAKDKYYSAIRIELAIH